MIKILTALLSFFKELFTERKEDLEFNSIHFNLKKLAQIVIVTLSIGLNIILIDKIGTAAHKYFDLKKETDLLRKFILINEHKCIFYHHSKRPVKK